MSAAELLRRLRALGVNLRVEASELKVSAPKGVLTAELQQQLRSHKAELTEFLRIADSSGQAKKSANIPPADRSKAIPLSFAQQRMWFLEEFEGGTSVYNIPWAMRLRGAVDKVSMQAALDELVARHESLRTVFVKTEAEPEQKVLAHLPVVIEEFAMHGADDAVLQSKLESWSQEAFDLETGPLLRVRLIELGTDDQVLMMTIHHIVSDAWSLDVLQTEFFGSYLARCQGKQPALAELPLQFADYAVWQRGFLQGDELQRQLDYWTGKLRGAPPLLELPTDYPRPSEQSYRGSRLRRLLSVELREQLKELAKQNNATLFMVLLAAFDVLLARYSGQDDVVVGTPIAGRQQTELEGLIGLFLNTLALRAELTEGQSFNELLQQVQNTALDAYAHQELPFDKLVDALQPSRDMSHSPVFQAQFMLQNAPASGKPLAGLEIASVEFEYGTAKFDLTLATGETPDGLVAEIEYATDLFDAVTIERMLEHYERLLRAIVDNPQTRVSELPLAGAEDLAVLAKLNDTAVDYPQEATLQTLFELQAAQTPAATALIFENSQLSYAQLNQRANQLAHWLRANGLVADTMVGVYMERSVEMVVAMLGIIKAGGAYVPLDPEYPEQRIVHMLEDADMALLLTQSHLTEQLPENKLSLLELDTAADELTALSADNPPVVAGPESLAYAIFTSGSTGRPKGVMNEHHGIVNRLLWMQSEYQLNAADRVLQKTPFSFDVSVWEFFLPLITGATLVVARPGGHKDSTYLVNIIRAQAITTLHFVPSMLQVFLQDGDATSCTSLHKVFCSGEALPHDLQSRFFAAFATTELHNLYGPTEAAVDVTYWACQRDSADTSVPIGRPVANTQIHVVEPNGRLAPIGVAGELWIAGAQVARGYANRPDLTAERFIPDPFRDGQGARVYRSGDLVRWRNDGVLEFLGRIDHQVKLRGFRIELGEIEASLDALPSVEQSLVLLREDVPGQKRLVAYVSGAAGALPDVPVLRAALKSTLPEYMVPAVFMSLVEFPLLPNGKVDRKALPEPEGRRDVAGEFVPAATDHEKILAQVWSELLRVDRVGMNDNFFELGGDSILSIQIIARAAKAGLQLTPKQVFRHQTVAELAAVVGTATVIKAEQGAVTGAVPFTPVQTWFMQQGETGLKHFNQSVMLEVDAALSADQVATVITALHQHHDALRLQLLQVEGEWLLQLDEPTALPQLHRVSLAGLSADESAVAIQDECNRAQAAIDLSGGNLLAARYFERGMGQPALLMLAIHHLAIDGVGWRIVFEDLETAGQQVLQGAAVALPAKTSSFKSWAENLQGYAGSAELKDQLEYWQQVTAGGSNLPVDHAAGINTVGSAASVQLELSEEQTAALLKEVPRAYRTRINDILLTGLARALNRWCGQSESLIDLEGHGREELFDDLDVSRTLGWFTSIYPVKLALPAGQNPGADIKALKEQLRAVPGNGLGYGLLRYTSAATELQASPAAQILFNYLGQFDQALGDGGLFDVAPVAAGRDQAADRLRSHLLDVNGSILHGQLRIGIGYSEALHNRATIQKLADLYLEELQQLISYCQAPDNYGRTPSDFPLCVLDQSSVDRIIGQDAAVADIYPVTPMQHGILFHSIYEAGHDAYLSQVIWKLQGNIDVPAFGRAWQLIVDRHSALRSGIESDASGELLQVAYRGIDVPLGFADWSDQSAEQQQQKFQEFLATDRAESFDLAVPPLIRLNLFACGDDKYQFVWTYHHIVIDGWSVPVVIGELMDAYQSFIAGGMPELAEARPFGDYVEWLCKQEYSNAESFWRGNLSGLSAPTELPAATQIYNPSLGQGDYAQRGYTLSPETTQGLRDFARTHRLTLNTLAQGVLAILLSRYNAEERIIFGATTSGRPADLKHVESMVGLFINALPVATQVPADQDVLEWLIALQEQQLTARQYEFVSLTEVQGWSDVPRGTPLFNTLLVFENYPEVSSLWSRSSEALAITDMQPIEWNNYPLTVAVSVGEQFHLRLDFDRQYYQPATIDQLGRHFLGLLESVAARQYSRISDLPLLDHAEKQQLLYDWNDTALDYAADGTMHGLFEAQAAARPDAIALYVGGAEYSYAELNRRANKLATQLIDMGVGAEQLVGICIERSAEMLVGLLAILKAGGAYVPIDPNYPADRVAFMLKDSAAPVLLSQSSLLPDLSVHNAAVICLDNFDFSVSAADDNNPLGRCGPENLAYTIYTSGSTGKPKGVQLEHRSAVNFLTSMAITPGISDSDSLLSVTTLSFDISILELLLPLSTGARVVIATRAEAADGYALLRLIEQQSISMLQATPTTWRLLLEAGWERTPDLTVLCGGEALDRELAEQLHARSAAVWNMYGPTETTIWSSCHRFEPTDEVILVGRPIANTQMYVLDQQLQPVPAGVNGELYIGGDGLARGYRERPELTAERFVSDPFSAKSDARMYRTGDLARFRRDGTVQVLGRTDFQVKLRGFRIELGEIEACLSEQAHVKEAVVIVREDTPGDQRLVAYVTSAGAVSADVDELRNALLASLPAFMVPAAFVVLDEMPLTPNGKKDRNALPAPEFSATAEYVAPRTPAEETLVSIWCDVLGVEQIGIHDDFFMLGGHSLLATKVMVRVRDQLGAEPELRKLFQHPTIAEFGAVLEANEAVAGTASIPAVNHSEGAALSFAQQRLWFFNELDADSAAYNLTWPVRLTGDLNIAALTAAFGRLTERHEVLRTIFVARDGEPQQLILDKADIELPVVDMRAADDAGVREYLTELAGQHFELATGPLFGGRLLTLQDDEHILVISIHHIIADGWSMEVMYRELVAFYAAELDKVSADLPPLPIQYADYAIWQTKLLGSDAMLQQLDYWKGRLGDATPLLELPTDYARPSVQTYNGSTVTYWLTPELSAKVRKLAQQQSTTLFVLMQTVYAVLLARCSGQEDIVIGTPIAGRKYAELEGLIGLFLNTLALRTNLDGNPSFDELLAQVRDNTFAAYENQDIPFEKLVDELQPVRDMSHAPIFQVMFTVISPPGNPQGFRDLQVQPVEFDYQIAKFDLLLSVIDVPDSLGLSFEYNTDLFAAASIEKMYGYFLRLLEAVVADQSCRVHELPMLAAAERQQLLVDWNATEQAYPAAATLHEWFAVQVASRPDAEAVNCAGETLSYAQLDKRSNELAHHLRGLGAGPDVLVGLCTERSLDMATGVLGILKAGAAYVPLDPAYPADRIAYMLEDSAAAVLVTQAALCEELPTAGLEVVSIDQFVGSTPAAAAAPADTGVQADNLAYVIYTSGSTGKPKGVQLEHRGVINFLMSMAEQPGLTEADRLLAVTTLCFDISVLELMLPLVTGATVVIATRDESVDGYALIALLDKQAITVMQATPATWRMLLQSEWSGNAALKVLCGGEALDRELGEQLHANAAAVWNMYGPTETTIWSSCQQFEPTAAVISVGRPIGNTQMYVLDSQQQPVPVGVSGELFIAGDGVARGYKDRPELNAERFISNPFRSGERMYRSGDLARFLQNGELQIQGRTDFQVKLRGFRIELGEIESALTDCEPVNQAVVLLREDTPGDQRLVAYLTGDGDTDINELREQLYAALPNYMVPSAFVWLDAIPLTPNGKVNRKALPTPDWSAEQEYVAPATPTEIALADIWQNVLKIEKIGANDNFFVLGGHSLLATQLVARIRNILQLELPLMYIFDYPSVGSLAVAVDAFRLAKADAGDIADSDDLEDISI